MFVLIRRRALGEVDGMPHPDAHHPEPATPPPGSAIPETCRPARAAVREPPGRWPGLRVASRPEAHGAAEGLPTASPRPTNRRSCKNLRVAGGLVGGTSWRRKLLAFTLVAAIVICATLVVFVSLDKAWTVAVQVALAVSGAVLGSILQVDSAKSTIENQVRSAIRRHFDRATRLSVLVQRVEQFNAAIRLAAPGEGEIELNRAADRIDEIAFHLRDEINSNATAIEDWGDLARDVYESELERYQTRHERSPNGPADGGSS